MATENEPDIFAGDPFDPAVVEEVQRLEMAGVEVQDDTLKQYIARRANAYKAVFRPGNRSQDDIDIVLVDLMAFCRAYETRYHAEQKKQDMLEGRAEVFYRIRSQSRLDNDTLFLMMTDAIAKSQKRR